MSYQHLDDRFSHSKKEVCGGGKYIAKSPARLHDVSGLSRLWHHTMLAVACEQFSEGPERDLGELRRKLGRVGKWSVIDQKKESWICCTSFTCQSFLPCVFANLTPWWVWKNPVTWELSSHFSDDRINAPLVSATHVRCVAFLWCREIWIQASCSLVSLGEGWAAGLTGEGWAAGLTGQGWRKGFRQSWGVPGPAPFNYAQ